MDMKAFVKSLTFREMNELSIAIHEVRKEYILQNMKNYPLPDVDLLELCRKGKRIQAIIEYRKRTNVSLVEAKTVMDVF